MATLKKQMPDREELLGGEPKVPEGIEKPVPKVPFEAVKVSEAGRRPAETEQMSASAESDPFSQERVSLDTPNPEEEVPDDSVLPG